MIALWRHGRIIYSLILRDLLARFGRRNLGFVWTVLEPMLLTTGVMMVWSLIKEPIIHGVPIAAFVMTGYLPLTLSRHFTSGMVGILRHNANLLYHAPIKHVDIMAARGILEFLSTTMAMFIIYFVVVATGLAPAAVDPGLALAGWLMCTWHFAVVGVLTGTVTEYWEPMEKFIPPWQYLQLPISGIFFMVDWMPTYAQKLLLWNPTVHCYEMVRAGYFGEAIATHYDVGYLSLVTLGLSLIAVVAVMGVREHLQVH